MDEEKKKLNRLTNRLASEQDPNKIADIRERINETKANINKYEEAMDVANRNIRATKYLESLPEELPHPSSNRFKKAAGALTAILVADALARGDFKEVAKDIWDNVKEFGDKVAHGKLFDKVDKNGNIVEKSAFRMLEDLVVGEDARKQALKAFAKGDYLEGFKDVGLGFAQQVINGFGELAEIGAAGYKTLTDDRGISTKVYSEYRNKDLIPNVDFFNKAGANYTKNTGMSLNAANAITNSNAQAPFSPTLSTNNINSLAIGKDFANNILENANYNEKRIKSFIDQDRYSISLLKTGNDRFMGLSYSAEKETNVAKLMVGDIGYIPTNIPAINFADTLQNETFQKQLAQTISMVDTSVFPNHFNAKTPQELINELEKYSVSNTNFNQLQDMYQSGSDVIEKLRQKNQMGNLTEYTESIFDKIETIEDKFAQLEEKI